MRPLTNLERFFEQLFERPAARLFHPRLQPVQLQRRIERAMETDRMSGADRTLVPNRFRVHLNPEDLDAFGDLGNKQQIVDAYQRFSEAVNDITSAFPK